MYARTGLVITLTSDMIVAKNRHRTATAKKPLQHEQNVWGTTVTATLSTDSQLPRVTATLAHSATLSLTEPTVLTSA